MNTQILTSRDHNPDGLPQLHFTVNWNNKLDARAFTTIRTPDRRWKSGTELAVYEMRDWFRGVVTVWSTRKTTLRELTDEQCFLDTGHRKKETVKFLYEAYGDYLRNNGMDDAPLVIVTLVKKDEYFVRHDMPALEAGPMGDYREFRQHRPSKEAKPSTQDNPVLEFNLFTHSR